MQGTGISPICTITEMLTCGAKIWRVYRPRVAPRLFTSKLPERTCTNPSQREHAQSESPTPEAMIMPGTGLIHYG